MTDKLTQAHIAREIAAGNQAAAKKIGCNKAEADLYERTKAATMACLCIELGRQ